MTMVISFIICAFQKQHGYIIIIEDIGKEGIGCCIEWDYIGF